MARSRRLLALIRRYPTSLVAYRVGVTESTVKRWLRSGKVPDKHAPAVESLSNVQRVTKKAEKETLKLTGAQLAALAGVSLEEARRWKVKREIPFNKSSFLYFDETASAMPEAYRIAFIPLEPHLGERFLTKIYEFPLNDEIELDPFYVEWLINNIRKLARNVRADRFQFVIEGSTILSLDVFVPYERPNTSAEYQLSPSLGFRLLTLPCGDYKTLERALTSTDPGDGYKKSANSPGISLDQELMRMIPYSFFVSKISLVTRIAK